MPDPRTAIADLVFAYAERIDAGDFQGVANLFEHGRITVEGSDLVRTGAEEVLEMYRRTTRIYEETGTPRTKHVTTNLVIEVDSTGGVASCRSYFTVFQATPVLPLQPVIAGRYHDRFELGDGAWRFTHRHMICDLFGDLSQHLMIDPGAPPPA